MFVILSWVSLSAGERALASGEGAGFASVGEVAFGAVFGSAGVAGLSMVRAAVLSGMPLAVSVAVAVPAWAVGVTAGRSGLSGLAAAAVAGVGWFDIADAAASLESSVVEATGSAA